MDSFNLACDSGGSKGSAGRMMDMSEFHGPQNHACISNTEDVTQDRFQNISRENFGKLH